jgi:fibronectin type 3 domain-containing protein
MYRSATSGGPYTRISSSVINALDYHDDDVQSGSRYFYVVTAVDAEGTESAFSNQASALLPNP